MKKDNKKTGKSGEDLAEKFLLDKGYRIIERNFHTRFGEIDLIGYEGKTLVFVEVKTKIGHDFGEPEEMINKNKIGRVKRMAEIYLIENNLGEVICRVDVVGIVLREDMTVERLSHFEGVF